nr:hypothetical protein [uncultured Draconibacterium sp.]
MGEEITAQSLKNKWLSKDPFAKFQAKIVEVKREYLLKDELQNIEDLNKSYKKQYTTRY